MPIEFRCPNCEKKLRTADEKAGKTAKCPQCGTPVVVPGASQAEDDFDQFPAFGDIEDRAAVMPPPSGRSAVATEVACPMCGAMNDARATRCLSCGEDLGDAVVAATGRTPSLRFGDIWETAWGKWTANLGLSVASILIAAAMVAVAYGLLVFLAVIGFGAVGFAGAGGGNNPGPAFLVGIFAAMAFGYLAILALLIYIQLGLSNFSLNLARHQQGSLGDMFPPIHKLPAILICMFVVYLAVFVAMLPGLAAQVGGQAMMMNDNNAVGLLLVLLGYGLQMAGAVVPMVFFWPIPYLIADRRSGLFASLVDGPKLAIYDWKLSLLLAVVNVGLSFLGSLACGVGLLFTYSLSFLLFAVAYDRLAKRTRIA
ncbi:MAG: zinc-ribbon domain-containing protein [Planctomycetota bacterium]|nr:hypothetical protein [Planctomycetaceae bacterium]MDQ3330797.1 zinc-ribbon domain-containing protein [Planctomycetota bacterium]